MGADDDEATVAYPAPSAELLAGRYRLGDLLGRGGMASVYRAHDESLGRTVAIKMFHAGLAHAQDTRRQREETSLLAGFNHPALVTLFDAVSGEESSFLVMEFVEGVDLRNRMSTGLPDHREVARIGADVAGALAYIHDKGVVHRDVKPANILLPRVIDGSHPTHAKLADFGIARLIDSTHLTETGTLIGTASYLSPEQALGREVAGASDVYSLALVLLECLTGQRAFPGSAVESSVARVSRDPDIPQTLGSEWVSLLRAGTSRDQAARPTADAIARQLRSIASADSVDDTLILPAGKGDDDRATVRMLAHDQKTEVLEPPDAVTPPPPRRGRTLVLAAAVVVTAVVVVAAVGIWIARPGQTGDQDAAPTTTEVSYPAVDGDLGAHLDQLQQSVAP